MTASMSSLGDGGRRRRCLQWRIDPRRASLGETENKRCKNEMRSVEPEEAHADAAGAAPALLVSGGRRAWAGSGDMGGLPEPGGRRDAARSRAVDHLPMVWMGTVWPSAI